MAESRPFRVIIGGGGISGLTLANALEKANVDYLLLEGRDTIAPQVGASIGIFANGGRILDQLGCYDMLKEQTVPLDMFHNRYENGKLIYTNNSVPLTTKRYVITIAFCRKHPVKVFNVVST
jgi:2-polyprenyl-6-methoxyphenol hydroxylase-like FAD-dependent oxidoreductase